MSVIANAKLKPRLVIKCSVFQYFRSEFRSKFQGPESLTNFPLGPFFIRPDAPERVPLSLFIYDVYFSKVKFE